MNINQYIFREYDVRGKVEDDFPPEVVESLGKAFGTFIKRGAVSYTHLTLPTNREV